VLTVLRATGAVAVLWLVGHALVRGRLPAGLTGLEALAARLVVGLGALSVGAVALADAGLHAPWSVATVALAMIAIGFACNPSGADAWPGFTRTDAVLAVAAVATVLLALPGFEWSLGGRDAGTYVNEAVQIQERGAVEVTEPSLATVPPAVRDYLGRSGLYPGEDAGRGSARIVRLGFHTWPALRAAAGYATDDAGAWSLAVIAGLALLLTTFAAFRLAPRHGEAAALATAVILLCSVAFSWYARFPMTELPALAMLAGGIWLWAVSAPAQNAYGAGTAGVLLGLTFLYRPDGLFTLAAVALLAVWLVVTGRFGRAAWALTLATLVTAIVAFLHIARFAWGYFTSNWDRHAHAVAYVAPAALLVLAVIALLAARRRRAVEAFLERHAGTIGLVLTVLAAGGVGLIIVGGRLLGWNGATWVTWYAEWPGVALAVAGIALATTPAYARDRGAVLFLPVAVLLGTLAIYGVNARVSLDHFWAVRRLVSSVLPLLAVFAGVAVAYLWADRRLRVIAVVALAATAVLEALDLRPALRFDEYRGSTRQLAALDRLLGPPDTLVITPWLNPDHPDGRYGVPLRARFHRDAVPVISFELAPLADYVRDQTGRRPVRLVALLGRVPTLPRGVRAVRESRITLDLPAYDQPTDRIPRGGHRLKIPLTVYRLVRTDQ
jgi:hypothetical protein